MNITVTVLMVALLLITVLSAGTIAALIGSEGGKTKQQIKYRAQQKELVDAWITNYKNEQLNRVEKDVQKALHDSWLEVQNVRRQDSFDIISIKNETEKARYDLNIVKEERYQLTSAALVAQKDKEIERLTDLLKRAVTAKGQSL